MTRCSSRGVAVIAAMMAMLLMFAMGTTLALGVAAELKISAAFRSGEQAFHAADAGLERVLADLRDLANWTPALSGGVRSHFADGPPGGQRVLSDGTTIDLDHVLRRANCHKTSACSRSDEIEATSDRPWGPNNPVWQPFAYGPLGNLLPPGFIGPPFYILVMVGDDGAENDEEPLEDGDDPSRNPGSRRIEIRSEAFGPFGAHRALAMTLVRERVTDPDTGDLIRTVVRARSWRELRELPP